MSAVYLRSITEDAAPIIFAVLVTGVACTALTGTSRAYGRPDVLVMLASFVSLLSLIAIGWTVGVLIPNVVVPGALFFVYPVVSYLAVSASDLKWTNLLAGSPDTLGNFVRPAWVSAFQIICFGALTALAVFASSREWALAFVSLMVVSALIGILLSIPQDRALLADPRAQEAVCSGQAPRICLSRLHANQLGRLEATLEPMSALITAHWPSGVTFVENGAALPDDAGAGKTVVFMDLWAGLGGGAAHFDRDSTLAMMANELLGTPLQCPLWQETGSKTGVRTLGGEVMVWFGQRYDVDVRSVGGPLQLPSYVTATRLALTLKDRPDRTVLSWLTSPHVQEELRTCGASDGVATPSTA